MSILYISHKLEEIRTICTKATSPPVTATKTDAKKDSATAFTSDTATTYHTNPYQVQKPNPKFPKLLIGHPRNPPRTPEFPTRYPRFPPKQTRSSTSHPRNLPKSPRFPTKNPRFPDRTVHFPT